MNYIIYHSKRCIRDIGELKVYHDSFKGNQDPYIWNENFLHTFCHITQIRADTNDIIFWVSGDGGYPNFSKLLVDCVFVIDKKCFWKEPNRIDINDPIVENNLQAYKHHYEWAESQHKFEKRKRFTFKADSKKSYQPQDKNKQLIDIVPFLNEHGISIDSLTNKISKTKNNKRAINSTPYEISRELAQRLYDHLWTISEIKLTGNMLKNIHPNKIQNL